MSSASERARGALYGLAIGDALGMPTQMLSREDVAAHFGVIDGFREASSDHIIAAGLPAGSITNDTEQALLLADVLLSGGGHVDSEDLGRRCWPGPSMRGNEDHWTYWGRRPVHP
jgi:ADP-ribosylglycohydrolase